MASRTRKKRPGTSARRGASGARSAKANARPKRRAKATAASSGARAKSAKKGAATKAAARKSARPTTTAKRATAPRGGGVDKQIASLRARFEREKRTLEGRLTNSVREIGQLRHHEMRVTKLERELKGRDETIAQLRREIEQLRSRTDDRRSDTGSGQQSLALGDSGARDLDDFDDVEVDEDELI